MVNTRLIPYYDDINSLSPTVICNLNVLILYHDNFGNGFFTINIVLGFFCKPTKILRKLFQNVKSGERSPFA